LNWYRRRSAVEAVMQEVDNCNSLKDASSSSLLSIPPQSKKEKMVVKKSQPGVKAA
jgi:hypothetical protein